MRFAYADPVYLGCSKLYPEHPEAHIWDRPETHRELIRELVRDYPDGWALSLSMPSLRTLLPMCPEDARVAAWVKTFCAFKKGVRPCYAWEPVIFWRGRNPGNGHAHAAPQKGGMQTTPKDYFAGSITLQKGLTGAKSEGFCAWVLDLLNVQPGDEVVDLFPGTGAMGRVAATRVNQMAMPTGHQQPTDDEWDLVLPTLWARQGGESQ